MLDPHDDLAGRSSAVDTAEDCLLVCGVSAERAEPPMELSANGGWPHFGAVFIGAPTKERRDEFESVDTHGSVIPRALAVATRASTRALLAGLSLFFQPFQVSRRPGIRSASKRPFCSAAFSVAIPETAVAKSCWFRATKRSRASSSGGIAARREASACALACASVAALVLAAAASASWRSSSRSCWSTSGRSENQP